MGLTVDVKTFSRPTAVCTPHRSVVADSSSSGLQHMQLSIFVATWGRTAMIRSRGIASFLDELSARGFAGVEATAEELGASLKERVEYCLLLQARGQNLGPRPGAGHWLSQ